MKATPTDLLYNQGSSVLPVFGYLLLWAAIIAVLCLLVFIWYKAAQSMAGIAADKGYTEKKWFHYCFWLGLVGFLMVCAMPDKNRR